MPLYSFKGHYPVEQIDSQEGWYEVPAKPVPAEGQEVAWVNAEWVVRDPKPEDRPGYQWNWNHNDRAWVECEYAQTAPEPVDPPPEPVTPPEPVYSLTFTAPSLASSSSVSFGSLGEEPQ